MTAPQPLALLDIYDEELNKALKNNDHELAREYLDSILELYKNKGDFRACLLHALGLTQLNNREGLFRFAEVISNGLVLNHQDEDNIEFFSHYAFYLSRLRYRIGDAPSEYNRIALDIAFKILKPNTPLRHKVLEHLMFVLFENNKDKDIEAVWKEHNLFSAGFFLMQIKALNDENDEAYAMLMDFCALYPDWNERKSVKNLFLAINNLYEPYNTFYRVMPNVEKASPNGIAAVIKSTDKSRVIKGIKKIGGLARQRHGKQVEQIQAPFQSGESLLQNILKERAAVFSELAHR